MDSKDTIKREQTEKVKYWPKKLKQLLSFMDFKDISAVANI